MLSLVILLWLGACNRPTEESNAPPTVSSAIAPDRTEVGPVSPSASPLPLQAAAPPALVLDVASAVSILSWNPLQSLGAEAAFLANMYEQLLRINPPGSTELFSPLLATAWETNADGTVWTFHLRTGVTFHDGEALTAEAVRLSLEAAAERGAAGFIWRSLRRIEVIDSLTVALHMDSPQSVDRIASSLYGAWIISPKALTAVSEDAHYFDSGAAGGVSAGTGPYQLSHYSPGSEIVLQRFEGYWGGWSPGQFDIVQSQLEPSAEVQKQLLLTGAVDLVSRIPVENLSDFQNDPAYQTLIEDTLFSYLALINTSHPPLDDPLVRQALSYAVPYEELGEAVEGNLATRNHGSLPPNVWPWMPEIPQYFYNLEKARDLLDRAGFPGGGFQLHLTYAAENPIQAAIAGLLVQAFSELEVDLTIEGLPFDDQLARARTNPTDAQDIFLLTYWPVLPDGSETLRALFYPTDVPFLNLSYWAPPELNSLLDEAARLTPVDPAGALSTYRTIENMIFEDAPALFFFETQSVFVLPSALQGFQYNLYYPLAPYLFYNLTLR